MVTPLHWKRGHLLERAGTLLVAGAFARTAVPVAATAPCPPGFSAHRSRLGAHRYEPRTGTLLGVILSPLVDQGNGYVTGLHQALRVAELSGRCATCSSPAAPATFTTTPFGDAVEIHPACDACAVGHSGQLVELIAEAGVSVAFRSADIERWSRQPRPQREPTGCACALTNELTAQRGLRWYLRDLWVFEGVTDRVARTRCVVCGTRWAYERETWPPRARQIPDPR